MLVIFMASEEGRKMYAIMTSVKLPMALSGLGIIEAAFKAAEKSDKATIKKEIVAVYHGDKVWKLTINLIGGVRILLFPGNEYSSVDTDEKFKKWKENITPYGIAEQSAYEEFALVVDPTQDGVIALAFSSASKEEEEYKIVANFINSMFAVLAPGW